jgi:hypothetical protein
MVKPEARQLLRPPEGSEKEELTGTVTRFRETLLMAIFMAYKTLNMTKAMPSDVDNLFGTKNP